MTALHFRKLREGQLRLAFSFSDRTPSATGGAYSTRLRRGIRTRGCHIRKQAMSLSGIMFSAILMVFAAPDLWAGRQESSDTTAFTLVKTYDGVRLYERWYSIAGGEQARELKARFDVKSDAAAAVALIRDQGRGTTWNSRTKKYRILPSGTDAWLCHIEYDFPWPVSDQDCVLEFSERLIDGFLEVSFKGMDDPAFPARHNVQRIRNIAGKWVFRRAEDGISVEYFITTKPSTTLPAWITDPIIRNNLMTTLTSFRGILEADGH